MSTVIDSAKNDRIADADIPRWLGRHLQEGDLQAVREAVEAAELKTHAEIVPMIVSKSVSLESAKRLTWIFSSLTLALCGSQAIYFYQSGETSLESWISLSTLLLISFAVWCLGYFSPRFLLRLMPKSEVASWIDARAELEFYRLNIRETRSNTGVLLFVSLLEHRVVVLADKAIADVYDRDAWQDVVRAVLAHAGDGRLAKGLCDAIHVCADKLNQKFPYEKSDIDELPNRLVIKE